MEDIVKERSILKEKLAELREESVRQKSVQSSTPAIRCIKVTD
jgi:hypothetical protein